MKADCLFALHGHKKQAVAVVESQEDEDEAADINADQGGPSAATGGAAISGVASEAASAAVRAPDRDPAEGRVGGKALTPNEAAAACRRHLLEPLVVRGEGVSLQGHSGVSLWLAGKLVAQGCLNAVTPGQLVHIVDQLMGRRFLINIGASYSIFPHRSTSPPSGPLLTAASRYHAGARGWFNWTFMAAGSSVRSIWRTSHSPLLGSTFCAAISC